MLEGNIWGIGVDDVHGLIYWNDNGNIKQATLNGANTKIIIKAGKSNVTYIFISCMIVIVCFICYSPGSALCDRNIFEENIDFLLMFVLHTM